MGNIETCLDFLEPGVFLEYEGQTVGMPGDSSLLATYTTQIIPETNGLNKNVVTVTILDWWSAITTDGTFIYTDGDTEATYDMSIPQGFTMSGTCIVSTSPNLRFTGTSTDITIDDPNIAPANLVEVFFDFIF